MPFPYDLSECIMRCMWKDHDVARLKNASLVCRSWSAASRTWLFRRLQLNPNKYDELLSLMRESRTCSFVSHCRILDLRYLDIVAITPRFAAFFTHLSALYIRGAPVSSLNALFELISRFPSVCSISLHDLSFQTSVSSALPFLPMVERVEVFGDMNFGHFFEAIRRFEVFPNLEHLGVGPLKEIHVPAFGKFLHSPLTPWPHGKSQSLTMSLALEEDDSMSYDMAQPLLHQVSHQHQYPDLASRNWSPLHKLFIQTYGVEPCVGSDARLSHFKLKGFVDVRNAMQSTAIKWTPRILASFGMPNLQHIEFDLILDRAGQLDQYDIHWVFIDLALSTEGCVNPKRVIFVVLGPSDLMGVADILCRRLPKTAERGILYLRSGDDGEDQDARAALLH